MTFKELDAGNCHSGVDDALLESSSLGMLNLFTMEGLDISYHKIALVVKGMKNLLFFLSIAKSQLRLGDFKEHDLIEQTSASQRN